MPLVPISSRTHAATRIRPLASFAFAARATAIPLYGSEIVPFSYEMPVVFVAEDDGYAPVALTGLSTGRNLLIDEQGRWLGGRIPAVWRRGPFRLARTEGAGDDNMVLCLDDSSELIDEAAGTPLFDEQGAPTELIGTATTLLSQLENDGRATRAICAALKRHDLIAPWKLEVPQADGSVQRVSDLFHVDEAKIAALPADELAGLRDMGALPLIYAHLLSLARVNHLARLARQAEERDRQRAAARTGKLDLDQAFGIVEDDPFIF